MFLIKDNQEQERGAGMSEGSDDFGQSCRHCGTTRHPLRLGRRCKYCDKLVQRRQRALRWQMDKPQSLKGCALFCNGMYPTPQQFEQFRTNYLRDIDEQLQRRRHMETRLHGRITGLDLEHILCGVADATRIEKGHALFHGIAGYLESVFDANAASALYKLLYRIIEARPTRPNYQQFFKGVFDDTVGSVPPGNKVGPKD
jgi:hypothetical protein